MIGWPVYYVILFLLSQAYQNDCLENWYVMRNGVNFDAKLSSILKMSSKIQARSLLLEMIILKVPNNWTIVIKSYFLILIVIHSLE